MKVYVAGRTTNFREVRRYQQLIVNLGHTLTYDWTANASDVEWDKAVEGGRTPSAMRSNAENDVQGVIDADAVVAVMSPGVVGTYMEIGMALALRIPVLLVNEPERDSVFFYLPEVRRISTLFPEMALQETLGRLAHPDK